MIFRAISVYIKAKKGIHDPVGLVTDEIRDAFIGAAILPGLILAVVTIFLGILSFSSLITTPSITAQVFFWIFIVVFLVYVLIISLLKKLLERLLVKIENLQNKIPQE